MSPKSFESSIPIIPDHVPTVVSSESQINTVNVGTQANIVHAIPSPITCEGIMEF